MKQLVLVAFIRNEGRQAVTVQTCRWAIGDIMLAQPSSQLGDSFPRRLEAGDQCKAIIELEVVSLATKASAKALKTRRRRVRAAVDLGTGRTVRSRPLNMPPDAGK